MASTDQVNPKISPSDDEVVAAVEAIRTAAPELGREKVRARLITENNWLLSESRLKKLLAERGLESSVVRDQFIKYPANALQAQERYKADSTRCFKLYARGEHDFGVPPNCAQALKIDVETFILLRILPRADLKLQIAHQRLVEHGHPTSRSEAEALARSWPMQYMWDFYWAAAQKAGIAKADVGGQLKAESVLSRVLFAYFRIGTSH